MHGKGMRFLAGAALLFVSGAGAVRGANATEVAPVILIQNATLLTVSHGTIEHGSVLIQNGKIAAVGQGLKAPEGAQVIDASGQYVMPGIIDCHSHIAVDGDVNEGSISVSSIANDPEPTDSIEVAIRVAVS